MVSYNQPPIEVLQVNNHEIAMFNTDTNEGNIDLKTVESFGNEWEKFSAFSDKEIFWTISVFDAEGIVEREDTIKSYKFE